MHVCRSLEQPHGRSRTLAARGTACKLPQRLPLDQLHQYHRAGMDGILHRRHPHDAGMIEPEHYLVFLAQPKAALRQASVALVEPFGEPHHTVARHPPHHRPAVTARLGIAVHGSHDGHIILPTQLRRTF